MRRGPRGWAALACAVALHAPDGYARDPLADQSIVDRGKYLVVAGNCATCHTGPAAIAFAGGLPFTTPFGTVYSTNITPDEATGIGRWSQEQFRRALREGRRPNGEHLYPVFPYTAFAKLTTADADAMFAYLKTIPAVSYDAPAPQMSFPFSQRRLMSLWNALFFDATPFAADTAQSAEWNRGAYLVEGLGHCGACHSPRNFLGAERKSAALTGGTYLDEVRTGELREWSAVNLTSAASGMGPWSIDDVVAYLKTGLNGYATAFGPMNEVIMNSTRHLADADLRAMAVYLKSLPPREQDLGSQPDASAMNEGESLYSVHCATCHLPTGKGAMDTGPAMAGNPVVQAASPASLINVILDGPQLPNPPPIQRTRMDPYKDKLSDEEIALVASYIRNAWGNRAGAVSADEVHAQR